MKAKRKKVTANDRLEARHRRELKRAHALAKNLEGVFNQTMAVMERDMTEMRVTLQRKIAGYAQQVTEAQAEAEWWKQRAEFYKEAHAILKPAKAKKKRK